MTEALADRLLALLVHDRSLPAEAVRQAASRLGWQDAAAAGRATPMLDLLHARLAAEAWLQALRCMATSRRFWLGSQQDTAARLLLGRGRIVLSRLLPPEPPLRRLVAEFHAHQPWIGHACNACVSPRSNRWPATASQQPPLAAPAGQHIGIPAPP